MRSEVLLPELRLTPEEWEVMAAADQCWLTEMRLFGTRAGGVRQDYALAAESVFQHRLATLAGQYTDRLLDRLNYWLPVSELRLHPSCSSRPGRWLFGSLKKKG